MAGTPPTDPLVFQVRVKPGSKGEWVGGTWGEDDGPLNVSVSKPAVDGQANRAVTSLLARAMKVRERQVSVISGAKSRVKTIRIENPPEGSAERLNWWKNKR